MTASLWIPGPLPGLNDLIAAAKGAGGTGRAYARLKRAWTTTVWALAKRERLPRFERRVYAQFSWWERDRRRDLDNVAAGGRKLALDGLVKAGVLAGDGWKHVAGWTDDFFVVGAPYPGSADGRRNAPGVLVTLIGLVEAA